MTIASLASLLNPSSSFIFSHLTFAFAPVRQRPPVGKLRVQVVEGCSLGARNAKGIAGLLTSLCVLHFWIASTVALLFSLRLFRTSETKYKLKLICMHYTTLTGIMIRSMM